MDKREGRRGARGRERGRGEEFDVISSQNSMTNDVKVFFLLVTKKQVDDWMVARRACLVHSRIVRRFRSSLF